MEYVILYPACRNHHPITAIVSQASRIFPARHGKIREIAHGKIRLTCDLHQLSLMLLSRPLFMEFQVDGHLSPEQYQIFRV